MIDEARWSNVRAYMEPGEQPLQNTPAQKVQPRPNTQGQKVEDVYLRPGVILLSDQALYASFDVIEPSDEQLVRIPLGSITRNDVDRDLQFGVIFDTDDGEGFIVAHLYPSALSRTLVKELRARVRAARRRR